MMIFGIICEDIRSLPPAFKSNLGRVEKLMMDLFRIGFLEESPIFFWWN